MRRRKSHAITSPTLAAVRVIANGAWPDNDGKLWHVLETDTGVIEQFGVGERGGQVRVRLSRAELNVWLPVTHVEMISHQAAPHTD